jgi:O-antigen ligase
MISTILFLLSILLACLFGSSNQAWGWGPALLALAAALVVSAFERAERDSAVRPSRSILILVLTSSVYLAVRAVLSPVWDFALADLLIVAAVVGSFLLGTHIVKSGRRLKLFLGGLGGIVLLNFAVALLQVGDPEFSVLGLPRITKFPTGLFTQYSYFANFMIGSGCLLLAVALLRWDHPLKRTLWGLAAAAAFASVCLSRSRGSLVGLAFGGLILLVLLLPTMKKRSRRAFAAMVVILPLLVIAGGLATGKMLMATQQVRGQTATLEGLSDNVLRLHFLGVALEGASVHPWFGGGSQSFRWECRGTWDVKAWGMMTKDPDFVHNEFMQALTDYGIVGLALVLIVLVTLLIVGFAAVFVSPEKGREALDRQAVIVGALAGLTGMFCQANFSFVFHTLPPVLVAGLLAGLVAGNCGRAESKRGGVGAGTFARLLSIALGMGLVYPALGGARTLEILLRRGNDGESRLRRAAELWPSGEFDLALGHFLYARSQEVDSRSERVRIGKEAAAAYSAALERNPFEPEAAVNLARTLTMLGQEEESEEVFLRAIALQGALEAGYKAHHYYAEHLYQRGLAEFRQSKFREAKELTKAARRHLTESGKLARPYQFPKNSVRALRLNTYWLDDYLAGYLAYQDGHDLWMQRKPEEALVLFAEAEKVLAKIRTPQNRRPAPDSEEAKLLAEVRRMIKFLEGAGIQPAGEPDSE